MAHPSGPADEAQVARLQEMGFSEDQSREALRLSSNQARTQPGMRLLLPLCAVDAEPTASLRIWCMTNRRSWQWSGYSSRLTSHPAPQCRRPDRAPWRTIRLCLIKT